MKYTLGAKLFLLMVLMGNVTALYALFNVISG